MRSAISPPRQTLPPSEGSGGVITLDQIRPHPRASNEYVDSPSGQPLGNTTSVKPVVRTATTRVVLPNTRNSGLRNINTHIVTDQPSISPPLKKDPVIEEDDGIICSKCGKCRCGSCTEPRELPSRWICDDTVQISPENAVNCVSCFCCIQGVFYHCGKDEQDSDYVCYQDPCACCTKPHCCKRWTCMAMMAVCLPCLCLYWPAKGAIKACTACYNKCRKKGCQCKSNSQSENKSSKSYKNTSSQSQRRLLLIESDSSSA